MSYSIDANILLYAADRSSVRHEQAMAFLSEAVARTEVVGLAWCTVFAFLRISTHPRIFANPLSPEEAMANIDQLLSYGHVRFLSEMDGFWDIYREVADQTVIRGNLVPDAHLAAILKQHGVQTLFTHDSDFRKFSFLRTRNPFGSS